MVLTRGTINGKNIYYDKERINTDKTYKLKIQQQIAELKEVATFADVTTKLDEERAARIAAHEAGKKPETKKLTQQEINRQHIENNPRLSSSKIAEPIDLTAMQPGVKMQPGEEAPTKISTPQQSYRQQALQEHPKLTRILETTAIINTAVAGVLTGILAAQAITGAIATKAAASTISKQIVTLTKGGESLIGRRIPEKIIQHVGKISKLTKEGTQQLKRGIGKLRVNEVKDLIAGGAPNLKTAALKTSYLAKLASTAKNPIAVMSVLGTVLYTSLFWAPNEKGDALTLLTIAQRDAVKAGDFDLAREIEELITETADIAANIPVIGFVKAELAKFAAAKKASEASMAAAEKAIQEAATEEPTFQEQRETSDIAARERDLENRKEDEEYFSKIAADKAKATKESREQDEKFYAGIDKQKRENELQQRKEDEKYYAGLRAEKEDRKAAERKADEEYWANIYSQNQKRKSGDKPATIPQLEEIKGKPLTQTEKKKVFDWNAGKSALNFLWLGL